MDIVQLNIQALLRAKNLVGALWLAGKGNFLCTEVESSVQPMLHTVLLRRPA